MGVQPADPHNEWAMAFENAPCQIAPWNTMTEPRGPSAGAAAFAAMCYRGTRNQRERQVGA